MIVRAMVMFFALTGAASAKELTAELFESLCNGEDTGGINFCAGYSVGVATMLNDRCRLDRKGKGNSEGFMALDLGDKNGFDLVDQFRLRMEDPEFRAQWGGQPAHYALFFAASEQWPCH